MNAGPVWAVLPVKRFDRAKVRLAGCLDRAQRAALCRTMLTDVLSALARTRGIACIMVVSDEPSLAGLHSRFDFLSCPEIARGGLNAAAAQGVTAAHRSGAEAVLILHSDLPLASAASLDALLAAHRRSGAAVTLVADRRGRGTNAMACPADGTMSFAYGPDSFEAHRGLARSRGMPVRSFISADLALDIDDRSDLALLRGRLSGGRVGHATRAWLQHEAPAAGGGRRAEASS